MQVYGTESPQLAGDGPEAATLALLMYLTNYSYIVDCCDRERRKKERRDAVGYNSCRGLSSMAVILGANNCFFRCAALLNCNSTFFFHDQQGV